MSDSKPLFEELDYRETPLGELILRRRTVLALDGLDVYEIILGDAFLMSSLFTAVEEALADLGLAAVLKSRPAVGKLEVVVGGLGLGYTARAALGHEAVGSLIVVDYLEPVIEWHRSGLVPLGAELSADDRCRFVHADFFECALASPGEPSFDPEQSERRFDAVLLDIDHSPANLLHERHSAFYRSAGLERFARKLKPGGVFALWSDDPPEPEFMAALDEVFDSCQSHVVTFPNPLLERESKSTVYVATMA